jgi:hypothetical protein
LPNKNCPKANNRQKFSESVHPACIPFPPCGACTLEIRVTRFGAFLPIGRLFTLDSFCFHSKSGMNSLSAFIRGKNRVFIMTQMYWALFSQTYLVTLLEMNGTAKEIKIV